MSEYSRHENLRFQGRIFKCTKRFVRHLDSRIRNPWQGRLFLESIEDGPVEEVEIPVLGIDEV